MKNFKTILLLTFILFCAGAFSFQDGFSAVKCDADIPKALIGHTMRNERAVAIENRHKNIGLKDLGGSEISDRLFSASWKICGAEYMLLQDKTTVRDVLLIPEHSKKTPEFIGGECTANGTKVAESIVAVLNNEEGKAMLSAKEAWKIDEKRAKFVKLSTDGLLCPRDGIITEDGGH